MSLRNRALKAEWRNIGKHRMLLISIIVMLLIPIMYGGFFLGSIWDPYGNTKNLPVAVVNEDEGAELHGQHLRVGDDLVGELKKNTDMGWRFVSAADAARGIDDGTYYMRLVIPKDFSSKATTVTETTPSKSTIEYTLTPARNYVASLLTKQAANTIAATVSTNVSKAYVSALFDNIATLQSGLNEAASGASSVASGSQDLSAGIITYTDGVSAVAGGQSSLNVGIATLSNSALALKNGLNELNSGLPTKSELAQLKGGVTSVQSGISALNAAVKNPDAALVAQQATVLADVASLQQKLGAYGTAMAGASADIVALQTAIASSQTTTTVNATNVLAIVNTSQAVSLQAVTLLTDLNTLNTMLTSQQTSLTTNVAALDVGVSTLTPNLLSALGGYSTIATGASDLLSGANQLYGGSTMALGGSTRLLSGLGTLNGSSAALRSGATELADGSSTLATALTRASTELAAQPTNEATIEQIVSPVATNEVIKGDVPNYGYALSPYVLSLGLFVGAFVFSVIYPIRRFFDKPKNAFSWWAAKMSVAATVAVGQAIVLDVIMIFGLGLRPDNLAQFVLLSIVTSLTYMSIIMLLALSLDNVGRFLAMLLLVLQLGSAGGVFPIVLSSSFFQAVNPFVPMTYSIHAYREAISSGMGAEVYWLNLAVLAVAIIAVNLLIVLFFKVHGMRHFKHESIDA